MTITIWIKPDDLDRFAELVKKIENEYVLNSEIRDRFIVWADRPADEWIQAQIKYSTYSRLKDA